MDDTKPPPLTHDLPEICSMGFMLFDPIWEQRMHRSTHNELIYILKGEMDLVLEDESVHAQPGDMLLIPPNTLHRDAFDIDSGLEVFFISFLWDSIERQDHFFKEVSNKRITQIPPYRRAELAVLFDQIRSNLSHAMETDQLVARSQLNTILLIILQESLNLSGTNNTVTSGETKRKKLLQEAKVYLKNNLSECISLNDIADHLQVSGYYLSHVFSEESEFTLYAYLTTLRMEKAKALLKENQLKISEIAEATGYESANYFSKAFKKHAGITPSDYSRSCSTNSDQ